MIVIDSSALLAILKQEAEAALIARTLASRSPRHISASTYLECSIVTFSRFGPIGLHELYGLADHLKLDIVPFDREQAQTGMEAYRRYGRGSKHRANLNFGDCFAYALARTRNLPLLFKGDDFIHTDVEPALKPG